MADQRAAIQEAQPFTRKGSLSIQRAWAYLRLLKATGELPPYGSISIEQLFGEFTDFAYAAQSEAEAVEINEWWKNNSSGTTGNLESVENIVGLRSVVSTYLLDNSSAEVLGYYTRGDGGGGFFYLDKADTTTADDNGYVIVDTSGGRWKRNFTESVNVRFYGAKGDGATNDTTALQSSVAKAKTLEVPVFIPAGTYITTTTLDCRSVNDNFAGIVGDGMLKSVILATGTNYPILRISQRYQNYEGFTLQYNTQQTVSNTLSNCIQFEDWIFFCSFRNLLLIGGYRGVGHVEGDNVDQDASFFSNTVSNIRTLNAVYEAVYTGGVGGGTGNAWSDIYISSPNVSSLTRGFVRQGAFGDVINQLNVEQSNIRDSAVYLANCDNMVINGLHMEGLRMYGKGTSGGDTINSACIWTNGRGTLQLNGWQIDSCYFGPIPVLGASQVAGVMTVTLELYESQNQTLGFRVGDTFALTGFNEVDYNATFTVLSVSGYELTAAINPAAAATATVVSGNDYGTCQLGSASIVISGVLAAGNCENVVGYLRHRDLWISGANSAARTVMFRYAAETGSNSKVSLNALCTQGQADNISWPFYMPIVGASVTSNVATIYTRYPHNLYTNMTIGIRGMSNATFNVNRTVLAVTGPHSFTMNLVTGDLALFREASGSIVVVQFTSLTRSRSSGIAEVQTNAAHGVLPGQRFAIRSLGDSSFDDVETVNISNVANILAYANPGADVPVTVDTGGLIMPLNSGIPSVFPTPSGSTILKRAGLWNFGAVVLNPGGILTGATATSTLTFINTHTTDRVVLALPTSTGLIITAFVSAAGTITFSMNNPTAGTITPSPFLVYFEIVKT